MHYYQTLKEIPWPLKVEKRKKNYKNFQKTWKKLQKLVSFCVFVVPEHIAHKLVITITFFSQKAFINF